MLKTASLIVSFLFGIHFKVRCISRVKHSKELCVRVFYQLSKALPEILLHLAKRVVVKGVRLKETPKNYKCEIFEGYKTKLRKGLPGYLSQ